jgi:hypothetical protein
VIYVTNLSLRQVTGMRIYALILGNSKESDALKMHLHSHTAE